MDTEKVYPAEHRPDHVAKQTVVSSLERLVIFTTVTETGWLQHGAFDYSAIWPQPARSARSGKHLHHPRSRRAVRETGHAVFHRQRQLGHASPRHEGFLALETSVSAAAH